MLLSTISWRIWCHQTGCGRHACLRSLRAYCTYLHLLFCSSVIVGNMYEIKPCYNNNQGKKGKKADAFQIRNGSHRRWSRFVKYLPSQKSVFQDFERLYDGKIAERWGLSSSVFKMIRLLAPSTTKLVGSGRWKAWESGNHAWIHSKEPTQSKMIKEIWKCSCWWRKMEGCSRRCKTYPP